MPYSAIALMARVARSTTEPAGPSEGGGERMSRVTIASKPLSIAILHATYGPSPPMLPKTGADPPSSPMLGAPFPPEAAPPFDCCGDESRMLVTRRMRCLSLCVMREDERDVLSVLPSATVGNPGPAPDPAPALGLGLATGIAAAAMPLPDESALIRLLVVELGVLPSESPDPMRVSAECCRAK